MRMWLCRVCVLLWPRLTPQPPEMHAEQPKAGACNAPADPALPLLPGLPPVCDSRCRLLILGSFPSVASLQAVQYYAHPRNQFWPLVAALCGVDMVALPYAQRLFALRNCRLGVWDVYSHCRRQGSLDSAIHDAQRSDLVGLRDRLPQLRAVAHNGGESARAMRWVQTTLQVPAFKLPSSSPAHAAWSFERKRQAWQVVFDRVFEQAGIG